MWCKWLVAVLAKSRCTIGSRWCRTWLGAPKRFGLKLRLVRSRCSCRLTRPRRGVVVRRCCPMGRRLSVRLSATKVRWWVCCRRMRLITVCRKPTRRPSCVGRVSLSLVRFLAPPLTKLANCRMLWLSVLVCVLTKVAKFRRRQ